MHRLTPLLLRLGLYYPLRRSVLAWRQRGATPAQVFAAIYRENRWQGSESRSGEGSSWRQTERLAHALPDVLRRLEVKSLLDVPCGDFHWMSRVDLTGIHYIGGDIVPEVIAANSAAHHAPGRDFRVLDLTVGPLPAADMVFCRDCLVHLPFALIRCALDQVRASGARYLMATTFPDTQVNHDITVGDFRPINLQRAPFHFPPPLELVVEGCTEAGGRHADKAMGVWRVADLPDAAGTA